MSQLCDKIMDRRRQFSWRRISNTKSMLKSSEAHLVLMYDEDGGIDSTKVITIECSVCPSDVMSEHAPCVHAMRVITQALNTNTYALDINTTCDIVELSTLIVEKHSKLNKSAITILTPTYFHGTHIPVDDCLEIATEKNTRHTLDR